MKKNLFLTFCFSFVPGAGQMYQCYMKKGMSLLTVVALSIMIAVLANLELLLIPAILVWVYSFFDTYHLRNKIGTENQEEDICIWENEEITKLFGERKFEKKNTLLGILLIIVGTYILFNSVLGRIASSYDLDILGDIVRIVSRYLPSTLIAVLSIVFGFKFISGKE